MHFAGLQQRSTYTLLFVVVLCGILWTGYFLGTDRDVFAPFRQLRPPSNRPSGPSRVMGKPPPGFPYSHAIDLAIPAGTKIIGLVFFGRRELVHVLDCYLKVRPPSPLLRILVITLKKRNLKENGGLLDEVIWSVNTNKVDDLAYLEDLLASNPSYRKHVGAKYEWYIGAWEAVDDPSAVYLKIDDDVVSRGLTASSQRYADTSTGLFRGQYDPSSRQTVARQPAIFRSICERRQQPSTVVGTWQDGTLRGLLSRKYL